MYCIDVIMCFATKYKNPVFKGMISFFIFVEIYILNNFSNICTIPKIYLGFIILASINKKVIAQSFRVQSN